ncbi:DEAD/DEAH box helicase [Vibrio parahaemolyticus]|uniref:DEAD/DEAH box helicase n=1 Tax=Vibrio parahaemolyticus TaxID=670 RepID=UPI002362EF2D|nr:helicase-related protein [Vibrio parahaemolyticus]
MSSNVTAVRIDLDEIRQPLLTDPMGMRPMQRRVFDKRDAQYLLIKSPPASGKSRALMFLGLDKLHNQGLRKVIVAVPEVSIGSSFADTDLESHGFYSNWKVKSEWDLCSPGADHGVGARSKVKKLLAFLESDDSALVCTHATLRFAFQEAGETIFDNCVLSIDEFHHSSSSEDSKLGELLRCVIKRDKAHVIAMTGSYFRGDDMAIMSVEDESRFTHVSYTYWEQMAAYKYLKTLKINYSFYSAIDGSYLQALPKIFDLSKKTIIHIPHRMSPETAGSKHDEVDAIIELIGEIQHTEESTNFYPVVTKDGQTLIVANLVEDDPEFRSKLQASLRDKVQQERVDIIIALGMAKEGFDWPPAEHAITIGYRGSLTEIIQIIGRVTRDHKNKPTAIFTNLIAEPRTEDEQVVTAVNQMLKAISVSLAMEQALAPKFKFIPKTGDNSKGKGEQDLNTGEIVIAVKDLREPKSERAKQIIDQEIDELVAAVCQNPDVIKAMANEEVPGELVQDVYVRRVIEQKYPNESEEDIEAIRQHVAATMAMASVGNTQNSVDKGDGEKGGTNNFVGLVRKFININDLSVDLIDSVNPFGHAYEVLSKGLTSELLKKVHGVASTQKIRMTEEEALALWPRIEEFARDQGHPPRFESEVALERRLGEALEWLKNKRREHMKA